MYGLKTAGRIFRNEAQAADRQPIAFSQDRILDVLLKTGGLTTITPTDPFLIEPDDEEGGSGAF